MARLPRLALADHLHLVVQQGHNGRAVFLGDADRQDFLAMLNDAARAQQVAIHAYVLLDTEVRLLATPGQDDSLGRLMQALGRRYVSAFNRRHERTGTLWNGRFRSCVLQASAWLLPATLVLESLPVRAGVVAQAGDWRWSSARHHLGRERSALINEHSVYWHLGNTPFERELAHANLLSEGAPTSHVETLDAAVRGAKVCGDIAFRGEVAQRLVRPVQPRRRGRPRQAGRSELTLPPGKTT
jgi:putative transposase